MRSLLIGCTLLIIGSCAALAQQDPPPAQGGSPNAPDQAVPTTAAQAAVPGTKKPMPGTAPMMHHKKMHKKKHNAM